MPFDFDRIIERALYYGRSSDRTIKVRNASIATLCPKSDISMSSLLLLLMPVTHKKFHFIDFIPSNSGPCPWEFWVENAILQSLSQLKLALIFVLIAQTDKSLGIQKKGGDSRLILTPDPRFWQRIWYFWDWLEVIAWGKLSGIS